MIETTKAIEVFQKNIGRTHALIEAMDKIKAYNHLYQMRESKDNPKQAKTIEKIQDQQLSWIEQSCAEHAIISLATAFETYYKDLVQELLAEHSDRFMARINNSNQVHDLIKSKKKVSFDLIEKKLKLNNRFDYLDFLRSLSIPFLSSKDAELIEYIYAKRNHYVHNANRSDKRTKVKLQKIKPPVEEEVIQTEAKRLCTKLEHIVFSVHKKIIIFLNESYK
ncbi:MAG: hypothetical protein KAV87_60300 [Desulfobacteraceae bacterium]|nr:hypothetical protein [Desulfobacteraceae bacterium]